MGLDNVGDHVVESNLVELNKRNQFWGREYCFGKGDMEEYKYEGETTVMENGMEKENYEKWTTVLEKYNYEEEIPSKSTLMIITLWSSACNMVAGILNEFW